MISHSKGFSLIEIMIALVVGLILLSGIIQLLISTRESFNTQSAISRIREDGEFAIQYVSDDLRNTDFWGCLRNSAQRVNHLNTSNRFYQFTAALSGTADLLTNQDSIMVSGVQPTSGLNQVIEPYPETTVSPLTVAAPSGINPSAILFVSDCLHGDIFQVTNPAANAGLLAHLAGVGAPGNVSDTLSAVYGEGAYVYFPYTHEYHIKANESGQPSLYMTVATGDQALVDNVEQMLVLYGEDTDQDGVVNRYVRASQVSDMDKVLSLRLYLVLRTAEDHLAATPQAYLLNGVMVKPNDTRLRRVYSQTIILRNRLK